MLTSISGLHRYGDNMLMEPPKNFFPSKAEFTRLVSVLTIASIVALSCNFIVTLLDRQPKPFCDINLNPEDQRSGLCKQCPMYGNCHNGILECVHGYRKHGSACVEDENINEAAWKLSKWVEMHICQANVRTVCNGIGSLWFSEDQTWIMVDNFYVAEGFGMDKGAYDIGKLKARDITNRILEKREKINGLNEVKCPDILMEKYKPFSCHIRHWLSKHLSIIAFISASSTGCFLLLLRVRRRSSITTRAEQLYKQVCDILEEKAIESKTRNERDESWMVSSWLRDHLLLSSDRRDPLLWNKVEELVREDSRLDRYPKLVKGEQKVVWEWQVEGSLSLLRGRKRPPGGSVEASTQVGKSVYNVM